MLSRNDVPKSEQKKLRQILPRAFQARVNQPSSLVWVTECLFFQPTEADSVLCSSKISKVNIMCAFPVSPFPITQFSDQGERLALRSVKASGLESDSKK